MTQVLSPTHTRTQHTYTQILMQIDGTVLLCVQAGLETTKKVSTQKASEEIDKYCFKARGGNRVCRQVWGGGNRDTTKKVGLINECIRVLLMKVWNHISG